jgi:hypothetical protein
MKLLCINFQILINFNKFSTYLFEMQVDLKFLFCNLDFVM